MDCKQVIEKRLRDARGVAFRVDHHEPAFSAQEAAANEHVPGRMFARTVVAVADDLVVLLVVPATEHIDFEKAAAALRLPGLRLAREEELLDTFPGCEEGAVPPFGSVYGLETWVDRSLAGEEQIASCAGTHSDTIVMKYDDFASLEHPTVCDLRHEAVPA